MNKTSGTRRDMFIASALALPLCWAPMSLGEDVGTLADFVAQVREIESIHIRASVDIRIFDSGGINIDAAGNGAVIEGTYELWMSGDRYRVESLMDPAMYPGMSTTLAYDGDLFQMLMGDSGVLLISSQDTDADAMTLPNPIVEMLPFLSPLTDETQHRRIRLKDVIKNEAPVDAVVSAPWEPIERGFMAVEETERAVLPGGVYKGIAYEHHVYTIPGKRDRPLRIDRVLPHEKVWTTTRFSHYFDEENDNGVTSWPRHIVFEGYNEEDELAAQITYVIFELDLGEPINDDVFIIDQNDVRVWDEDAGQFVK